MDTRRLKFANRHTRDLTIALAAIERPLPRGKSYPPYWTILDGGSVGCAMPNTAVQCNCPYAL
jgi:hypothetical protein